MPQFSIKAHGVFLVLAGLFIGLHWTALRLIVYQGWTDPNWSHAFVIPFISLYLLQLRQEEWQARPVSAGWWGVPVMLLGMAGDALGLYVHSSMVLGYSMVLTLGGLVLLVAGWPRMKVLWLPVAYLLFMVKITLFWDPIAQFLQRLAAVAAAQTVSVAGLPLQIEADAIGTRLLLYRAGAAVQPVLSVDEACSGLRMLMAMIALSVALAFAAPRRWWARLALILLAVPVAVLVNVVRIAITGLLAPFFPKLCQGLNHELLGLLMVVPALALLLLLAHACDILTAAATRRPHPEVTS